jgi:hypothetical protein
MGNARISPPPALTKKYQMENLVKKKDMWEDHGCEWKKYQEEFLVDADGGETL